MAKEVEEEIDKLLYKDVADIVKSYIIAKCRKCEDNFLVEEIYEAVKGGYYCEKCITKPEISSCAKCCKYYSIFDSEVVCVICMRCCMVYCDSCFLESKMSIYVYETDNDHNRYYWLGLINLPNRIELPDIDLINHLME